MRFLKVQKYVYFIVQLPLRYHVKQTTVKKLLQAMAILQKHQYLITTATMKKSIKLAENWAKPS